MGKLISTRFMVGSSPGWLGLLACFCLSGQQPLQAEDATAPANAPAPEHQESSIDPNQSRYAGADLDAYISPRAAAFAILNRETDPFGHPQDPDAKPVERAPVVAAAAQAVEEVRIPFAEIIRQVTISAVMPAQKQFLVGTRAISESDRFPIRFKGKDIDVEVTEVTSRQVTFRNLETDETASSVLDLLPEGMSKGGGRMTPPGMTSTSPTAPLQVGSSTNTTLASDR
jgi:hypothetical protein